MRPTAFYAPDGSVSGDAAWRRYAGASGSVADRVIIEAVLAHERQDDGLVHGHAWASAEATPPPQPRRNAWGLPLVMLARRADNRYDDGLAHNYDWAVSGR